MDVKYHYIIMPLLFLVSKKDWYIFSKILYKCYTYLVICKFTINHYTLFIVAIQCLEATYGIDMSDEQTVAKYQVQRNLLDIFNAQMSAEVSWSLLSPRPTKSYTLFKFYTISFNCNFKIVLKYGTVCQCQCKTYKGSVKWGNPLLATEVTLTFWPNTQ